MSFIELAFWIIFFPSLFVALTVLAINLVGDGLRDTFDPKRARRMYAKDECSGGLRTTRPLPPRHLTTGTH